MTDTEIDIFSIKLPACIENIKDKYNALTILIQETTGLGPEEEQILSDVSIGTAREIIPSTSDRLLEIYWEDYVGYSVLNESYANVEEVTQHPERKYKYAVELLSNGWFTEYMKRAVFADDDYPGPLKYWEVIGSNHVVHVWSHIEPTVRVMKPIEPVTTH